MVVVVLKAIMLMNITTTTTDDDDDGVTHRLTVGSWTNGTQLATHRLETNAVFYVKTKIWLYLFIYLVLHRRLSF